MALLTDHFTATELLAAAEAADVYPADRAEYWAVNKGKGRVYWPSALVAKYP